MHIKLLFCNKSLLIIFNICYSIVHFVIFSYICFRNYMIENEHN